MLLKHETPKQCTTTTTTTTTTGRVKGDACDILLRQSLIKDDVGTM